MKRRYGTPSRKRFEFRNSARIEKQVNALMRHYAFFNYSALFRTLIREAYERLPDGEKVDLD